MILIIIITSSGCIIMAYKNDYKGNNNVNNNYKKLNTIIDTDIPEDSTILKFEDGHSGFLGDGELYSEVQLTENGTKKFIADSEKTKKWKDIPLTTDIKIIVYGGDYNGVNYDIGHKSKSIPQDIKNGIYYNRDRFAEAHPEEKSKDINSRTSYNVTVAILDFDTNKLYIYQLDT